MQKMTLVSSSIWWLLCQTFPRYWVACLYQFICSYSIQPCMSNLQVNFPERCSCFMIFSSWSYSVPYLQTSPCMYVIFVPGMKMPSCASFLSSSEVSRNTSCTPLPTPILQWFWGVPMSPVNEAIYRSVVSLFALWVDLAGAAKRLAGLGSTLVGAHLESRYVFACIHLFLCELPLVLLCLLGPKDGAGIAGLFLC